MLSSENKKRYARQVLVKEIGGEAGQEKLLNSKVLVVGAGGLGSPVCLYLAAAGIGTLGIADGDVVELSNLHRQVIHSETGWKEKVNKAHSARERCQSINSSCECVPISERITKESAGIILRDYDIVVECTDNLPIRYILNDECVAQNKPLVSAGVAAMQGHLTVYNYTNGPCLRCIHPVMPESSFLRSEINGILGVIPGVLGTLQALEVVKIASGMKDGVLSSRMLIFDGSTSDTRVVKLRGKQQNCPLNH